MMDDPETKRKKRLAAAERKRKSRARKKEWLRARAAEPLNMTIYSGTARCLEEMMAELDYEQRAEIVTRLIHGAHRLMQCDKSQIEALLKV